jgi:membrane protein implicated in regulation of membrane protease activity
MLVTVFFALDGFLFANWVVCVPEVKAQVGASADSLGLALLGISAGAVVTMMISGRLSARFGSRPMTVICATLMSLAVMLPAQATSVAALAAALFVFGAGFGGLDVSMNSSAVEPERQRIPTCSSRLSGCEVSVTSAISARSSRLRSFSEVLSAAHSLGTSRASRSICSREGSGAGAGLLAALAVTGGVLAASLAGLLAVGRSLRSVRSRRPRSGTEAMVGHIGVVRAGDSAARVFIDGGLWRAQPSLPEEGSALHDGDRVVVERVNGLTLGVRKAEEWELNP